MHEYDQIKNILFYNKVCKLNTLRDILTRSYLKAVINGTAGLSPFSNCAPFFRQPLPCPFPPLSFFFTQCHLKGLEQGNNISESKAAKLNVEEALGLPLHLISQP